MAPRITRSTSRRPLSPSIDGNGLKLRNTACARKIDLLPLTPSLEVVGMVEDDYTIMLAKQSKLQSSSFQATLQQSHAAQAAAATLVFAQSEAGTAVCISGDGLLLTCAHCVHDEEEGGSGVGVTKWLLFASGRIVRARCVAWDPRRDLALLQVTAAEPCPTTSIPQANDSPADPAFPFLPVATTPPRPNALIQCIGHPGSEDLEASTSGIMTDYDVLHTSTGHYRGLAKGQDPQDNSEIGALKHDCWTYWGHSGAPLLQSLGGGRWQLIGLHSSWDDETGMRRGVPLVAIRAFVREYCSGLEE